MTNILLARDSLPPGWIDASYGEAYVVKDILLNTFDLQEKFNCTYGELSYPTSAGHPSLVSFLENKYQAPVVITHGAKQALGGVFYALSKLGKFNMYLPAPYWALIPPIANMYGINCVPSEDGAEYDSYCCVAPNNPDGNCPTIEELKYLELIAKNKGVPFIHDAAYYNHVYLPDNYKLEVIGDVQIYSVSKLTGLSGLRLGYAVCNNPIFYQLIQEYVEITTVGVSILPQIMFHDLLLKMAANPSKTEFFERNAKLALLKSKNIIKQVNPDIFDTRDIEGTNGMFGWFKLGPKANFDKAKIKVVDGSLFGKPGYIRMNLAFNENKMQKIVRKLNNSI
jgi:aspartate/methionine/tyrosine aminotransferase